MRFAISQSQQQILQDRGFVELEGLLSEEECSSLNGLVLAEMQKRLPVKKKAFSFQEFFIAGRDLRVQLPTLEKVIRSTHLAECAVKLFKTKPLRLVYDQVLVSSLTAPFPKCPLVDMSSVQDFVGVLILNLAGTIDNEESPFPRKSGNGTFITEETTIDFSVLSQEKPYTCLIIAFAMRNAVYSPRLSDPHRYCFQEQGYAIGDRLKDPLHPIVYI